MSYFEFPHTRSYDGDLGFIIKRLEELTDAYNNFFDYNTIKFHDPITWTITEDYKANYIVYDDNSEAFYIAKQAVPAGIDITNADYWVLITPFKTDVEFSVNSINPIANKPVTRRFNLLDSDINDLNTALQSEISTRTTNEAALSARIDANEQALAAESGTRSSADTAINARIDEIIEGASVDPDAELLDIRVGYNAQTYPVAGDAVRGQVQDIYNNMSENSNNLICGVIQSAAIESDAKIHVGPLYSSYSMAIIPVESGEKYTFYIGSYSIVGGYFSSFPKDGDTTYNTTRVISSDMTLTAPIDGFFAVRVPVGVSYSQVWINKGEILLDYNPPVIARDTKARNDITALKTDYNYSLANSDNFNIVNAFDVGAYSGYIDNSGAISANVQYNYSALMPTKPGDKWLYRGKMSAVALSPVWGYSNSNFSNPTPLIEAGAVDGYIIITVPDNIYYIRAMGFIPSLASNTCLLLHGKNVLFWGAGTTGSESSIRTVFNSITDASKINKYKVCVLPGTYSFDSEFTEEEIETSGFRGVVVPDWVTLEGIHGGVTFSCTISSNSISTLNLGVGSSLKNLIITGQNCRYAVHDDYGYNNDNGEKVIENCVITANGCSYGYAYGAGCRSGEKLTFKNVKFTGSTYEDGGFLMHSNTGFSIPCMIEMFNCQFISLNGHAERACNIRALGNTGIVNKLFINNSRINGFYLEISSANVIDWTIEGAGNNSDYELVTASNDFKPDFFDED